MADEDWLNDLYEEEERLWRARWRAVLSSDRWRALRRDVIEHLGGKCQWPHCEALHTEADPHHLHHTSEGYLNLGRETPEMVRLLCRKHHYFIHALKGAR